MDNITTQPTHQVKNRGRSRHGFVLVIVLVLIALAGILLAGLARRSLQMSQQVAVEQERLQRQWGMVSCRRMILERAEDLIEAQAADIKPEELIWPLPRKLEGSVEMGGFEFDFSLADEDAKANLNAVYRRAPSEVSGVVAALSRGGGGELVTHLRLPPTKLRPEEPAPLRSWGQVFTPNRAGQSDKLPFAIMSATARMTCWGSGKLNIRRADDATIQAFCRTHVSPSALGELLTMRAEPGQTGLSALNDRLTIDNKDRTAIRRLVTDESQCHSLWLHCRGPHRTWTSLTIAHPGDGSGQESLTFQW